MRPRPRMLPRAARAILSLAALCGAALHTAGARGAPQEPPAEKLRLVYRAPEGCPDREEFLAAVRGRIGTDWEAAPDEPAREVEVSIAVSTTESVAHLSFVDPTGRQVSRVLAGATCHEVGSAIALVTALAIESRLTETGDDAESATSGSSAPPPAPSTTNAVVKGPPATSNTEATPVRTAPTSTTPRDFHVEAGALASVGSGVGPAVAFGGRGVVGIGWPRGPDLRVGVDYLMVLPTTLPVLEGVKVQMHQLAGRASGCPFAFPVGEVVSLLPCAGLQAGVAHAETLASPAVKAVGHADPAFVVLLAELRLDARLGAFFLEASGEVRFVVVHPEFALDVPGSRVPVWPVPAVAVGAALGVGLVL